MWSKKFWMDLAERAIKSFAQGVLLNLGVSDTGPFNIFETTWMNLVGFGLGAMTLSILMSLASLKVGDNSSASLVK